MLAFNWKYKYWATLLDSRQKTNPQTQTETILGHVVSAAYNMSIKVFGCAVTECISKLVSHDLIPHK